MDAESLVMMFRNEPASFAKLGEGDSGGGVVYLSPDGTQVIKTYHPHPRKDPPLKRAHKECHWMNREADLACVPRGASLVKVDGDVYLVREAGTIPFDWTARQFIAIRNTLTELAARRIILRDPAQVAVRADCSPFIFDFDCAQIMMPEVEQQEIWENIGASLMVWLERAGYPEWDHRELTRFNAEKEELRARLYRNAQPTEADRLAGGALKRRETLEREDAFERMADAEPDLPLARLFTAEEWAAVVVSHTPWLKHVVAAVEQLDGAMTAKQVAERNRLLAVKLKVEAIIERARQWSTRLWDEAGLLERTA